MRIATILLGENENRDEDGFMAMIRKALLYVKRASRDAKLVRALES
jgi:hypothetical protein